MPDWNEEIRRRLATLNLDPAREAEIAEELSQHLEDRYQGLMSRGASEEQASRAVVAELSENDLLARELKRVERPVKQEPAILGTADEVQAGRDDVLLLRFVPDNLPRLATVALDGRVQAFTALASLMTGVIFGLAPALQAAKADVNEALRESGRTGTGSRGQRLRNSFVVAETALALVLLAGAGLTLQSFWRLQAVEPGFHPDGVLTLRMLLPFTTHPKPSQRAEFFRQVLERLRSLPGVAAAGAVSRIPMAPGNNSGAMTGETPTVDSPMNPEAPYVEVEMRWASPAYFQAMGITLLRGRDFNDADAEGAPPVAVVDESFVRHFYPNEDPIGKRINVAGHSNGGTLTLLAARRRGERKVRGNIGTGFRVVVRLRAK